MSDKIITEHVYPPIPERGFDWSAVRDGYDGAPDSHCLVGRGPTEQAAIDDLLQQEQERTEDDGVTAAELDDNYRGRYRACL